MTAERKRKRLSAEQIAATRKRRSTRDIRCSYFHMKPTEPNKVVTSAMNWLVPWSTQQYPGSTRGIRQIVSFRVDKRQVLAWRQSNDAPVYAMEAFAAAMEARLQIGKTILEGLRNEINKKQARPKKPAGFMRKDETGLNMQNRRKVAAESVEPSERRGDREL